MITEYGLCLVAFPQTYPLFIWDHFNHTPQIATAEVVEDKMVKF